MRSSIGLLFLPALGLGACADDPGPFLPHVPQGPSVEEADEPYTVWLEQTRPPQVVRPDHVIITDEVTSDRAWVLGRRSRAHYDRLRAAGLVR